MYAIAFVLACLSCTPSHAYKTFDKSEGEVGAANTLARLLLSANSYALAGRAPFKTVTKRPSKTSGTTALWMAANPDSLATPIDLVGDGGVLKTVLRPGTGPLPTSGAMVEVHYEGKLLDTGVIFDSSRARGKTFRFTLGEGKVIGGWEVGLSTMQVGELAVLTCIPQYAYGASGIPPMIPPSATLVFEVELVGFQSAAQEASTFADDNPWTMRTPEDIKAAYEAKMAAKPAEKEGLEGLIEKVKSWYIFGLFSTRGERPPWYLNPLITFPSFFVMVGLTFYLVVALGGVHRGQMPDDEIFSMIGDT